jgi:hypothetical protein
MATVVQISFPIDRLYPPVRPTHRSLQIDLWSLFEIDLWSLFEIDLWSLFEIDLWSHTISE